MLQNTFDCPKDIIFRLGGDEFSILCVDKSIKEVTKLCDTLKKSIATEINHTQEKKLNKTTLSIGIIYIPFNYPYDNDYIIDAVDQALYQAKKAGKNRIGSYI